MRIHPCLELADADGGRVIRCLRCGHVFGPADRNYKQGAVMRLRHLAEIERHAVPPEERPLIYLQEYLCPGCGTLLQVDPFCPVLDSEEPVVWDIEIHGVDRTPKEGSEDATGTT